MSTTATPIPDEAVKIDIQDGVKSFHYQDITIDGARLTKLLLMIDSNDFVHMTMNVESLSTQTGENGPHHHVHFVESNDVFSSNEIEMGEIHWGCGHNGLLPLNAKKVVGAFSHSVKHPRWTIISPGPFKC